MKVLSVFLLLLGIFLFLGGIAGVIVAKTAREPSICGDVEYGQKRAKEATEGYEQLKENYQKYGYGTPSEGERRMAEEYRKKAEEYTKMAEESSMKCTEKKDKLKYWLTVSSIIAGFGFLLTITGIFNLPKRKAELR